MTEAHKQLVCGVSILVKTRRDNRPIKHACESAPQYPYDRCSFSSHGRHRDVLLVYCRRGKIIFRRCHGVRSFVINYSPCLWQSTNPFRELLQSAPIWRACRRGWAHSVNCSQMSFRPANRTPLSSHPGTLTCHRKQSWIIHSIGCRDSDRRRRSCAARRPAFINSRVYISAMRRHRTNRQRSPFSKSGSDELTGRFSTTSGVRHRMHRSTDRHAVPTRSAVLVVGVVGVWISCVKTTTP